jgi:hypothetical protein
MTRSSNIQRVEVCGKMVAQSQPLRSRFVRRVLCDSRPAVVIELSRSVGRKRVRLARLRGGLKDGKST